MYGTVLGSLVPAGAHGNIRLGGRLRGRPLLFRVSAMRPRPIILIGALVAVMLTGYYVNSNWRKAEVGAPAGQDRGSAYFWYSASRAYSASTLGRPIMLVCNSTGGVDVACMDMVTDTTGTLSPATIGGIICPGTNCTIKRFYGFGRNASNLDQTEVATRAELASNCKTGFPCARFSGRQYYATDKNVAASVYRPPQVAFVAERTGATAVLNPVLSFNGSNFGLVGFAATPDTATANSGVEEKERPAKDNELQTHGVILDHSVGTIETVYLGTDNLNHYLVGDFNEVGLYDFGDILQLKALCQNQASYYRVQASC